MKITYLETRSPTDWLYGAGVERAKVDQGIGRQVEIGDQWCNGV